VGPQSGRRTIFQFPKENRVRPIYDPTNPNFVDISQYCCYNAESVNPPETLDLEPLLEMKIHTWIGSQFGQPQYNLLALTPQQVAMPVRFWIYFSTRERADFWLTYNEDICPDCRATHGWVWVKAIDTDGNLNTTERWEITPWDPNDVKDSVWHDNGFANLWRYLPTRKGGVSTKCDFGDFAVPFMLWLDRK
jgi:hypothetical protein